MEKLVSENWSQNWNVEVTKENKMLLSLDLGHLAFKAFFGGLVFWYLSIENKKRTSNGHKKCKNSIQATKNISWKVVDF